MSRSYHSPQKFKSVNVGVFKFLISPVPPLPTPKWAWSFLHSSLPAGGSGPLSWTSTILFPYGLGLLMPSPQPFFIFCLLPFHSCPLNGFWLFFLILSTFVSPWKNIYHSSHTFDSISGWSRAGLKFTMLQKVRKGFCVLFLSFPHNCTYPHTTSIDYHISPVLQVGHVETRKSGDMLQIGV